MPLSLSTLADQVGAICMAILPLYRRLEAHVLAGERLHGDDTTVPVLAAGKTDVARIWDYVRDDRPFGGGAPPAAIFYYLRDRRGEHPQTQLAAWSGVLQADAYGGYNKLYELGRSPGPISQALCWSHGRRHFYELADIAESARRAARGNPAVGRVEVLTGTGRRRRWSAKVKARIVADTYATSVGEVADRYGVAKTQLFTWRRELRQPLPMVGAGPMFTPVIVGPTSPVPRPSVPPEPKPK